MTTPAKSMNAPISGFAGKAQVSPSKTEGMRRVFQESGAESPFSMVTPARRVPFDTPSYSPITTSNKRGSIPISSEAMELGKRIMQEAFESPMQPRRRVDSTPISKVSYSGLGSLIRTSSPTKPKPAPVRTETLDESMAMEREILRKQQVVQIEKALTSAKGTHSAQRRSTNEVVLEPKRPGTLWLRAKENGHKLYRSSTPIQLKVEFKAPPIWTEISEWNFVAAKDVRWTMDKTFKEAFPDKTPPVSYCLDETGLTLLPVAVFISIYGLLISSESLGYKKYFCHDVTKLISFYDTAKRCR
ncbi:hypothetical protein Ciccas_004950 [Cichlidogyrus casuarinus]|uniref:Uncharacterized protein n=1 Tax=Cichlidogyrus casuarinus TaxID=1844966 RepID=A0ABD2QA06_9PLAT